MSASLVGARRDRAQPARPSASTRPILNVALPTLVTDCTPAPSQLQWIVDAYVLVFAGLLLPPGALGDRYGRKRLLLIGLAVLRCRSLLAVFAAPPARLIAARAVMGVGAAIIIPLTLSSCRVFFEPKNAARPSPSGPPVMGSACRSARSSAATCSTTSGGARSS